MIKQLLSLLICMLFCWSCSFFEGNNRREPIQEVDTLVDFRSVDTFPLFPSCDYIPSPEKQWQCSQMEISRYVYAALKEQELQVKEPLHDTVYIKLKVDQLGVVTLSGVKLTDRVIKEIPRFDSIVRLSLDSIPKLQPAIKRAIPVSTEFTLPIILKN